MIVIKKLTRTCDSCPSQWDGETEDGKSVYIRYRWGCLTIEVDNILLLSKRIGDGLDGYLPYLNLTAAGSGKFGFPEQEI